MEAKNLNSEQTLANDPVANSYWFLTEDKTIAAETTFTIPANVTIVPNGGVIKGSGTLVGTNTKIEAGFVQIFDVNLKISGTWKVGLSHPEWFGDSDQGGTSSKDYLRIQKAIDLITVSFNDPILTCGKIECRPGSTYHIAQPIILKEGHSFDGGHSNFIYKISGGGKYMFRLDPLVPSAPRSGFNTISNLRLTNGSSSAEIANAYGIYCACQMCTIENVYTDRLYKTFVRSNSVYLDQITLKNIVVSRPQKPTSGDPYQIDIMFIGDNLLLDNIHVHSQSDQSEFLRVKGCGGGLIQRIINGTIRIEDSKGLIVSAIHQEFGNMKIYNSHVEINGWSHFKHPGQYAAAIYGRDTTGYEQRVVAIKNSLIIYNHELYSFNDEDDIYINGVSSIKIENVCRTAQREWTSASSLYGIKIKKHERFMQNPAINSIDSYICGQGNGGEWDYSAILKNFNAYYREPSKEDFGTVLNTFDIYTAADIINQTIGQRTTISSGQEVDYFAAVIFDKNRNIGVDTTAYPAINPKSISSNAYGVRILFNRYYYSGVLIRLFRKKKQKDYEQDSIYSYIDIPVVTSHNYYYDFYDKGMFGEPWIAIGDNESSLNNFKPQPCSSYQSFGLNVMVTMQNEPTKGTWMKGDIINLPSKRVIYGY